VKIKWHPIGMITKEIEKAAMDRLEGAGKHIESHAKQLCPVGKAVPRHGKPWTERIPGELRRSIHTERDDKELIVRVVAGSYMAFYGWWVEFGTVKMRARSYMRPAMRSPMVKAVIEGM